MTFNLRSEVKPLKSILELSHSSTSEIPSPVRRSLTNVCLTGAKALDTQIGENKPGKADLSKLHESSSKDRGKDRSLCIAASGIDVPQNLRYFKGEDPNFVPGGNGGIISSSPLSCVATTTRSTLGRRTNLAISFVVVIRGSSTWRKDGKRT